MTVGPTGGATLDDAIAAAYEAAAGVRPWSETCDVLCATMGLRRARIVGVDKASATLALSFEGGWQRPVTALHQVTVDEPDGLRPMPGPVTTLIDDADTLVLLKLHVAPGSSISADDRVEQIDRIRGHLGRAIRTHLRRRSDAPMSVAGQALLELVPQGVIVVDDARRIVYANPAARDLLGRRGPLVDRDGRLDGADLQSSRDLRSTIGSLCAGGSPSARGSTDRAVLRMLGAARRVELIVLAIAARPNPPEWLPGDDPRAILIVHPLDATPRLDPLIVSLAFDLSHAEARVASAIAEGAAPEQVAMRRGVSLSTVRSQLRAIYRKVGVRRQPEMVRKLLELPRLRPAVYAPKMLSKR